MNRIHAQAGALALLALTLASLSGCSTQPPSTVGTLPLGDDPVTLDPAAFSATIDNPSWPMTPGTRWTYRETDPDGDELTVVVIVTSDTRMIANGITARVVRDTVYRGDTIIEDTFDWYAQDQDGAIWYLGEDTAEFEDGHLSSTSGSFEAGVDGALPGIVIPADPQVGMRYRQEFSRGQAEDNGEILSLDEVVEVPAGLYENVLMTRDTITIEPDVEEHKFYAPGVGLVLTLDISGGSGREELIRIDTVPDGTGLGPLGQPD
ncbi:MAG: hypothetical protein ABL886_07825 [Rhodoglobus sp.]